MTDGDRFHDGDCIFMTRFAHLLRTVQSDLSRHEIAIGVMNLHFSVIVATKKNFFLTSMTAGAISSLPVMKIFALPVMKPHRMVQIYSFSCTIPQHATRIWTFFVTKSALFGAKVHCVEQNCTVLEQKWGCLS